MYSKNSGKNPWSLFLFVLLGIVIGGFLGYYLSSLPYMEWLNYGREFGLATPFFLELGIINITFGFMINVNIASVICVIIAVILFRKI